MFSVLILLFLFLGTHLFFPVPLSPKVPVFTQPALSRLPKSAYSVTEMILPMSEASEPVSE